MMPGFLVSCPHEGCGWRLTVHTDDAVFECPSCKREWRARITEEGAVALPLTKPAPVTAPAAPPPTVPAPEPLPPAQPRRSRTARRLLAILLLAGALGSASLGAYQAGWLESLSPAAQEDTAEGKPEDGPPGGSPADEIDPWDLALNLKERASHPDELVARFDVLQEERISARAASADGRWLAIGAGKFVHVWRIGRTPASVKLGEHPGPVTALAYTPDGETLLVGGGKDPGRGPGGWLQAWRVEGTAFKAGPSWEGPLDVSAVAVASDGETLAVGGLPCVPQGGEGPRLRLGKLGDNTLALSQEMESGLFPVRALAFSPDGKILASATAETVRLWDVGGQLLPRWLAWTLTVLLGLAGVGVLIRRRLGGWLTVAGVIASLVVGAVGVLRGGARFWAELPHPDGTVKTLAFASDGRTLAVGGSGLRLWDVGRPRPVELPPLRGMSGPVESLSFAPRGPWLFALAPSGEVVVGHITAGKVVRQYSLSHPEGGGMAVLGGRHIAVHGTAGKVALLRLWSHDGSEKTLAACSEALAKDLRNVGALVRRAQIHLRHGRPHQALKDLDATVLIDRKCKEAYWLRAMLRVRTDEQKDALADLNRVIELDPSDALAYYQRGLLRVRMQEYTAAKSDLDRAFDLDKRLAEISKDE